MRREITSQWKPRLARRLGMKSTEQGKFDTLKKPACWQRWLSLRTVHINSGITLLALLWFSISGCQRINLPRIDPYGSRIVLPFPNTTQLNGIEHKSGGKGILHGSGPAFAEPAAPPPCLDASCNGGVTNLFHKHKLIKHIEDKFEKHKPGACGEIQLTPTRIVAPVGGEVVLLAGVCGKDGYYVTRQPLEWMLSPDSVGTFIEVGDDTKSKLISSLRHDPKVEKLDVDYARGRTSNRETLITRGTQGCDDDIQLKEGQTWLSISSPSEGVSRITVLAPDSDIWDRRRQTATIYWVDFKSTAPSPQITRSGEAARLVTRVTKAENLKPATNWLVRYTILDPTVALFVPPAPGNEERIRINGSTADVRVDADGLAVVDIVAPPNGRGTTAVIVDVIRPAEPSDNLPELLLRREQTMVTFSSPGLTLEAFGPEVAAVGEQIPYSVVLANPGDLDAENIELTFNIPARTRLVSSSIQPDHVTNSGLIWDQDVLPARRQLDITVVLEALEPGEFDAIFSAKGQPNLSAEKAVRTQVIQPSVKVRFEPVGDIAQADVGSQINYEIDITNTGRQTLNDLVVLINSGPGLKIVADQLTEKGVEQRIPMLQPGQTSSLGVAFVVQQEGKLDANLKVITGNAILAEEDANVLGLPPRPKTPAIDVSVSFPETLPAGGRGTAIVTLKNTGETTLTGINVTISSDAALRAQAVDDINRIRRAGQQLVWSPQDLRSGTFGDSVVQLKIEFDGIAEAPQAAINVQATAAENVQDQAQAITRVVGNLVLPPDGSSGVNPAAPATRTGELKIVLRDLRDPTTVGKEFRYALQITNNQNLIDRNIQIQLKLPEGIDVVGIHELTGKDVFSQRTDNILTFPVVQTIRANESIDYIIRAVGRIPANIVMSARVASEAQPNWKEANESTTVTAN